MFSRRRKKNTITKRLFRSGFAVLVLTAFVVAIAFSVKSISSLGTSEFAKLTSPIFGKLGLSEDQTGQVAGEFVERLSQTGINVAESRQQQGEDPSSTGDISSASIVKNKTSIAIFADSANEFEQLELALNKAEEGDISYVIHLGDLSDWGDEGSLQKTYDILENSRTNWYVLPGDHDLGESVGPSNFVRVFGQRYGKLVLDDATILLFDNSANFTPIDEDMMAWFRSEVSGADFVMLSQPLYHPTSSRIMGIVDEEEQPAVRAQAEELLQLIRTSNVKAVFAADQHISSEHIDPTRPSLEHIVVGALARRRNLQSPRFTIFGVYENGNYDIEEIEL